jgi:hypothetical protein
LSARHPRWIAAVLLAAALVAGWPLLLPWTYDTHDGHYAFYNAAQFDHALRAGELPVRWLPDLFGGRGLPVFVYYHPLAFYLVSALHLFGLGFIAATKLLALATLPLSAWAMFAWLKEHVPAEAAAVGAAAYVAAPIHLVELHVKGDPPAALAFVFAPLVLLAIRRAAEGAPRGVPALAFASASLVLAHSVTAMILLPALALYALASLARPLPGRALRLAAGAGLGALLSVWHWGPALAERGLVYIDSRRGILAFDWREQFVAWWQLFSPLWGYHGSFPGTPDDMSFQLGPVHVAAIGLGLWGWRRSRGSMRVFVTWGLATAAIAVAMTLPISRPVWELIDSLDYVQYPFRFLMPAAVATAALIAAAVATMPTRSVLIVCAILPPALTGAFAAVERNGLYAAIAAFQACAGLAAVLAATRGRDPERRAAPALALLFAAVALPWSATPLHARLKGEPTVIPLHEADLAPERVRLGIRRTTARDDYLPRAVTESAIPPRDPAQEYLPPPDAPPPVELEVRRGDVRVGSVVRTARALRFEADSADGGIVALERHDFPGWEVTRASPPTWIAEPVAHGTDDAGRIVVSLPPGPQRVVARWTETPLRRRCDAASLAGLVIALALLRVRAGARWDPPAA